MRRWTPLVLLSLSLAIAAVGAVRAHRAQRSHQATAESLLRDYGTFAAWSFADRAAVLLSGSIRGALYPLRTALLSAAEPEQCLAAVLDEATTASSCGCGDPIGGRFAFHLPIAPEAGPLRTVGTAPDGGLDAAFATALAEHARTTYDADWPFAVAHTVLANGEEATIAYVRLEGASGDTAVYGLELDRRRIADRFLEALRRPDLLPASLTRGAENDELVAVTVRNPAGDTLYASDANADFGLAGRQELSPILGGGVVRAAVVAEAAEELIIGGLPRSRVPWMLLIFGLAGVLAIIAFSYLRRESQLARVRADFVASVSHELRTPLAQVRLFVETLRLGRYDTESEREWIMGSIDRETTRLAHLVENVLSFSRAERDTLPTERRPTDLADELRETVEAFSGLASSRRVHIALHGTDRVVARVHRESFRQVILNLLDNAVKYGPRGQTVTVSLSRAGDRVRIAVVDEGPGVNRSERDAIWEPYRRGESAVGTVAVGSGIGLSVVREIVERHGGTARVEDAPDGGARFVVELPAAGMPTTDSGRAGPGIASDENSHRRAS